MDLLTKDVSTVLHLPYHLASMLLRMNNWNKEKFVTQYFEDTDRLLNKLGLQFMAEDGEADLTRFDSMSDEAQSSTSSSASSSHAPHSTHIAPSISSPPASSLASPPSSSSSPHSEGDETATCPVCYDDFPIKETMALGCGHRSDKNHARSLEIVAT